MNTQNESNLGKGEYRSLIVWGNAHSGSYDLAKWIYDTRSHRTYIQYEELFEKLEDMGYNIFKENVDNLNVFDKDHGLFRDIVNSFEKDKNLEKLESAVNLILKYRVTLTVINEELIPEISEMLIVNSVLCHYSHIIMDFKKPFNRIKRYPDILNMEISDIVKKEIQCINSNKIIWDLFCKYRGRYVVLKHEELSPQSFDNSSILHIIFRYVFYTIIDFVDLQEAIYKEHIDIPEDKEKEILSWIEKLDVVDFNNMHVEV